MRRPEWWDELTEDQQQSGASGAVPLADDLYDEYLEELRREGLI